MAALTKTVSKKSVKYVQENLFSITFNLIVNDGAVEAINQNFSCEFRQGENVSEKVAEITKKMQAAIDNYKSEQVIFLSANLDTAVTNISGGLVL